MHAFLLGKIHWDNTCKVLKRGSGKSKCSVNIGILPFLLRFLFVTEQFLYQLSVLVWLPKKQSLRCGLCLLGKDPRTEGQSNGGSRSGMEKKPNKGFITGEVPASAWSHGVLWSISTLQHISYLEAREFSFYTPAPVCYWLWAILVGSNFPRTLALHTDRAAPVIHWKPPKKAVCASSLEQSM